MTQTNPSTERRRPLRHRMVSGYVPETTYNALNLAAERRGTTIETLVAQVLQVVGFEKAIATILNEKPATPRD